MLEAIERQTQRVTRALALTAVTCLLGVALLTMADVLLRWLFHAPIKGLIDAVSLLMAILSAACFPALILGRGNVTIRLIGDAAGRTARRALEAFGSLVTTAFFSLMAWQYVRFAAEMSASGERMAILKWPVGPWWWAVAAMIGVTAAVALLMTLRDIVGGRNQPSGGHSD